MQAETKGAPSGNTEQRSYMWSGVHILSCLSFNSNFQLYLLLLIILYDHMLCLCHIGFKLFESRNNRLTFFFVTCKHCSKNAHCMLRKIWPAKKEDRLCTVFLGFFFITHVNGTACTVWNSIYNVQGQAEKMPTLRCSDRGQWPGICKLHPGHLPGTWQHFHSSPHSGACMRGELGPDPRFLQLEPLCL